jgi:V/A-type H+-transporting ATPase subunit K
MKIKSFSSIVMVIGLTLITGGYLVGGNNTSAQPVEEPTPPRSDGMKFIGAGVAFGLAALGAGVAIGGVGAAGLAAITEKPELRSQALVFTALGESIAIYGIVVAIIILGQS